MIPCFTKTTTDTTDFDASREPLRAIRDLISACEGVFGTDCGEDEILRRAQEGFAALRKLFGDNRPGEEIADARMREPCAATDVTTLQLVSGALQCITKLLPAGERHVVNFTGDWEYFGSRTIADILDAANAALGETGHA